MLHLISTIVLLFAFILLALDIIKDVLELLSVLNVDQGTQGYRIGLVVGSTLRIFIYGYMLWYFYIQRL